MVYRAVLSIALAAMILWQVIPAGQAEAEQTYDGISAAEQLRGMNFLNQMREDMGLPGLVLDPSLTKAAIDHARYADAHYTLKSPGRSAETAGMTHFTKETPADRAASAGYKEAGMDIQETVYMDDRPYDVFDLGQHMRDLSLVHERRVILTNPGTAAVGIARIGKATVVVGAIKSKADANAPLQVALYPYDGMEGAMIETDGFMDPQHPLEGEGMTITVHSSRSDVSGMTATLQRKAGSRTIVVPLQVTATGSGAYELKADRLLRTGAEYAVHVSFQAGSETAVRDWTFTTSSFPAEMYIDDMPLIGSYNLVRIDPNGRVYVPIRFLSERFGAKVAWDKATQTVTITKDGLNMRMTVGNGTAYVNGKAIPLDSPPKLELYTTTIPLRFIAEAFGYEVNYFEKDRSVEIWTGFTDPVQPPAAASKQAS
ncbi:hypothetical protein GZH47_17115 [Paenibacillus rhizovicinus]|uniref:SCP domain-containing protein n=1 Tax=Paenibacillus rhizovicinus TaxID=2704463 RepID=A0A6C0P1M1_9BACL|nr:stalk domain-containing protein [Paenibacillus rhizovicinus]QHW32359.1 hypothetical protein GZH47_17115 [Paenibacillus rhizovicinus]